MPQLVGDRYVGIEDLQNGFQGEHKSKYVACAHQADEKRRFGNLLGVNCVEGQLGRKVQFFGVSLMRQIYYCEK